MAIERNYSRVTTWITTDTQNKRDNDTNDTVDKWTGLWNCGIGIVDGYCR